MRLFPVHEAQAEKGFFSPFLLVVPHGIDHLDLVQLSDRDHVIAKIGIADDHIEKHMARREEQDGLHDRLSAGNGRARVVSTASESLFATVESGAFNDALYYRLNVVTIDLTSPVAR